jgi:pyridoxine 5-phosphate synthase
MLKLGVNIDHVATVREARYKERKTGEPDPVEAALECERAGADGITAHLREDRRHIQARDIRALRRSVKRLNFEMANTSEIAAIALRTKPQIVCIVPERRMEITTEGGLDAARQEDPLRAVCQRFHRAGIEVSLFVAPDLPQIEASARIGADFIELHTGAFSEAYSRTDARLRQTKRLIRAAERAHALGLRVNAGHGLNYANVPGLRDVPHLVELNIGHSIVSRALMTGLKEAVEEMLDLMREYPG